MVSGNPLAEEYTCGLNAVASLMLSSKVALLLLRLPKAAKYRRSEQFDIN